MSDREELRGRLTELLRRPPIQNIDGVMSVRQFKKDHATATKLALKREATACQLSSAIETIRGYVERKAVA